MNRSDDPFRKCLECENIRECPEPEILQDGYGTVVMNRECQKRDQILLTCSQRARDYFERK